MVRSSCVNTGHVFFNASTFALLPVAKLPSVLRMVTSGAFLLAVYKLPELPRSFSYVNRKNTNNVRTAYKLFLILLLTFLPHIFKVLPLLSSISLCLFPQPLLLFLFAFLMVVFVHDVSCHDKRFFCGMCLSVCLKSSSLMSSLLVYLYP